VARGKLATSKIDLHVFDAGVEMKDARFTLYLASNPTRTPVVARSGDAVRDRSVALVKMK